jgi:hypothetical protein
MKMYARWLLIAALLTSTGSAWAHEVKGAHGGRITDTIDVFISDQSEKPVAASGFKGTAILVAGGKSQRVVLAPVDGVRLSGSAAALPNQPKGVVQLTGSDGKTIQAKFDRRETGQRSRQHRYE